MVQEILKMHMIDNSLQKLPKKEKNILMHGGFIIDLYLSGLDFSQNMRIGIFYLVICGILIIGHCKEDQLKSIYIGVYCVLGVVMFFQFPNVVSLANIPRGIYH
jgi:hypothetical protein